MQKGGTDFRYWPCTPGLLPCWPLAWEDNRTREKVTGKLVPVGNAAARWGLIYGRISSVCLKVCDVYVTSEGEKKRCESVKEGSVPLYGKIIPCYLL